MEITYVAISAVVFLVVGGAVGYLIRRYSGANKLAEAETKAKEIVLEAKEKAASLLVELKNEEKDRRKEIDALEARVLHREETLDKKLTDLSAEEAKLRAREEGAKAKEEMVAKKEGEIESRLEKIGALSVAEAKEEIMRRAKEDRSKDLAQSIQKIDRENREEVEKRANDIITIALQRYARSHVAEMTTTIFHLDDEELKGKIIGREGRNIRALERATGVEFIIDEAPDGDHHFVVRSVPPRGGAACAREAREGRPHPAGEDRGERGRRRRRTSRSARRRSARAAAQDLGVFDLPKELLQMIGRLHFRTSYGQNVLVHSVEMAYIAEMMARELGLNAEVAKKGALLHDIGKAIDHEVEGTHVELGMKLLRKYNIDERVIEAMQSHHDDYPYARPEAYVVTAADVLSAARPGARRGTLENYVKRLADLEKIAGEFNGVKSAYAIAAGRELRVFVIPEKVDDFRALELAREIANKIQSELKYPGEIKVNVIREMRAVEYAR